MSNTKFYYQWGDEKSGNVTTWTLSEENEVLVTGEMPRNEALEKGYTFKCIYS